MKTIFKKLLAVLCITLIVIALIILLFFFFITPLWNLVERPCIENEITFFARLMELIGMLIAFAVLRIYNAIVANTRFMIKLRESVVKIQRMLPGLDKTLKDLRASQAVLKSSIDKAEKTIKNSDSE